MYVYGGRYWNCRVSLLARSRQNTAAMSALLGHYLMHHYSATWSSLDVIGSEVGENINSIQAHFAFNRGAARQFHLPWFIDFSVRFLLHDLASLGSFQLVLPSVRI